MSCPVKAGPYYGLLEVKWRSARYFKQSYSFPKRTVENVAAPSRTHPCMNEAKTASIFPQIGCDGDFGRVD
ncbi:hypothetical protein KOW79_014356 [Hemibagrus wyckioides]|uniref:Uncharacterized protein n=1 Tax=Hemibagrus wyckioides TaxID=337641 RepID=A0A9D3NL93_9TELE|nr:hypothetical protein KOW79_014356 [Hemibagrus wyckioides]